MNLDDTQGSVLTLLFKITDDNGLMLLDMKDLQAMPALNIDDLVQVDSQGKGAVNILAAHQLH